MAIWQWTNDEESVCESVCVHADSDWCVLAKLCLWALAMVSHYMQTKKEISWWMIVWWVSFSMPPSLASSEKLCNEYEYRFVFQLFAVLWKLEHWSYLIHISSQQMRFSNMISWLWFTHPYQWRVINSCTLKTGTLSRHVNNWYIACSRRNRDSVCRKHCLARVLCTAGLLHYASPMHYVYIVVVIASTDMCIWFKQVQFIDAWHQIWKLCEIYFW